MLAILSAIFDRRLNPWVSVALQSAQAACLVLWFFCLTSEGELARIEWIHFGAEYEKRVLRRLETINQFMRSGQ